MIFLIGLLQEKSFELLFDQYINARRKPWWSLSGNAKRVQHDYLMLKRMESLFIISIFRNVFFTTLPLRMFQIFTYKLVWPRENWQIGWIINLYHSIFCSSPIFFQRKTIAGSILPKSNSKKYSLLIDYFESCRKTVIKKSYLKLIPKSSVNWRIFPLKTKNKK